MKHYINFSPVRSDEDILIDVDGNTVWVDGGEFDFSPLPEGALLPASAVNSKWFSGDIRRINGDLHYTLILPHGANASHARRFPEMIIVDEPASLYHILPEFDVVIDDEELEIDIEVPEEPVYPPIDETVYEPELPVETPVEHPEMEIEE